MFDDDAGAFLGDFGLPCEAVLTPGDAPVKFKGTLDSPAVVFDLGRAAAHSVEYELMYPTAAVALARGVPVRVGLMAYQCREAPRMIDDGLFSTVLLTKA